MIIQLDRAPLTTYQVITNHTLSNNLEGIGNMVGMFQHKTVFSLYPTLELRLCMANMKVAMAGEEWGINQSITLNIRREVHHIWDLTKVLDRLVFMGTIIGVSPGTVRARNGRRTKRGVRGVGGSNQQKERECRDRDIQFKQTGSDRL